MPTFPNRSMGLHLPRQHEVDTLKSGHSQGLVSLTYLISQLILVDTFLVVEEKALKNNNVKEFGVYRKEEASPGKRQA